jgi:hypothetical protein
LRARGIPNEFDKTASGGGVYLLQHINLPGRAWFPGFPLTSKTGQMSLVSRLVDANVNGIYELVGESLIPVTDAVRRNGKLQRIYVLHEDTALFVAGEAVRPALIDVVTRRERALHAFPYRHGSGGRRDRGQ